jgi:hypothetical protein
MAKFTNYTQGPKGLNTADGLVVFVEPGKSVDVEITKEEAASAKGTGWFSPPKAGEAEAAPELSDAEVIATFSEAEKAAYDKADAAKKAELLADKRAA